MKKAHLFSVALLMVATTLSAQSAEEIVRRMDASQTFDTLYVEGAMTTVDRFGEKSSSYKSWSRGGSDFLIEFTNVEERGQKVLRVEDELFLFYPDAEDIIPMHGAALKQSLFGDVSYEDITEGKDTLSQYDVKLLGSENLDGTDCWVIEMIAVSRDVPYPKQVIKVGKEDEVLRAAEYYARSGRLLKTVMVESIERFDDGRFVITKMVMEDQLRRGSSTAMMVTDVKIDPALDDALFSLDALF